MYKNLIILQTCSSIVLWCAMIFISYVFSSCIYVSAITFLFQSHVNVIYVSVTNCLSCLDKCWKCYEFSCSEVLFMVCSNFFKHSRLHNQHKIGEGGEGHWIRKRIFTSYWIRYSYELQIMQKCLQPQFGLANHLAFIAWFLS